MYRSHSLILVTGSSTWHLMAKNSEDLKKRIVALHENGVGYEKIAKTLKLSTAAQWPRAYSGLTGQVPLRTGLKMYLPDCFCLHFILNNFGLSEVMQLKIKATK